MPTFVFSGLKQAAFPGSRHPEALVHVPSTFDPRRFGLFVYFHGFDNCIENAAAAPPGIHDPPQPSADLIGQLERAGKSALLLMPETRPHANTGEPGRLAEPGVFSALFDEVLERLRSEHPPLADLGRQGLSHVVLFTHSGGYHAAAHVARHGGLPVHEVCLLDSLYGELEAYDEIVAAFASDHAAGQRARRFVSLYQGSAPAKHTRELVGKLREKLVQLGLPESSLYFDDSPEPLADEALAHPFVCKRVATAHSDFGMTHVAALLATSFLP